MAFSLRLQRHYHQAWSVAILSEKTGPVKRDDIVKKSKCEKLRIRKSVRYEARNIVLEAFDENDDHDEFANNQHSKSCAARTALPSSGGVGIDCGDDIVHPSPSSGGALMHGQKA